MQHPFELLRPEYTEQIARAVILPSRKAEVEDTASRLLRHYDRGDYGTVAEKTGIPIPFIMASFEREASSDFTRSPAQGDRWDRVSRNVPAGRGPFPNWEASALDAYHLDRLDGVGASNWSLERECFEGELFNGFGYRDYHKMASPYVFGGTTVQTLGKYKSDGKFDAFTMDTQLGILPIIETIGIMRPALALSVPIVKVNAPPLVPAPTNLGNDDHRVFWVQKTLNLLGTTPPLTEDGSYGRITRQAVIAFQQTHGLQDDGFAGPKTVAALEAALTTGNLTP